MENKARADGPKKVRLRDRFGQVTICAEVHCSSNVAPVTFGRDEDKQDGDCDWVGTESSNDAESVEFRHHHVAKNQVGFFFLRQLYADAAVLGGERVKLFQPEDGDQVATRRYSVTKPE